MTRKEMVDILNQFEAEHPVNEWTIDGIHVWPMVKIDLFWAWHNLNYTKDSTDTNSNNVKYVSKYHKIIHFLMGFIQWMNLLFSKKNTKKGFLFVGNSGTNISFNNRMINRYYQPIFEHLLDNCPDDVNVFYFRKDNLEVDPRVKVINEEDDKVFYFIYHLYHFSSIKKRVHLKDIDSFISIFKNIGILTSKKQFLSKLYLDARELKSRALYIQKVIQKYNIKAVFELCYYGNKRYAYNIAAYNCGIPSYDIQHGGMGNEHVAYANLNKVPKEGYKILPSHFWLWDEVSYKLLNRWVSKQSFHQCLIGGNPWLKYFFQNVNEKIYPINTEKKIILYTMQYSVLEDYIIEAIRNSPKEYIWWIRLHPRKIDDQILIAGIINKYKLNNQVEIQKASSYPLPYLLSKSYVHISGFSGSIIEAALLNVPSIIIDEIGVSSYHQYIENGYATIVLDKDYIHLLSAIKSFPSQNRNVDLEGDKSKYEEIINHLVKV